MKSWHNLVIVMSRQTCIMTRREKQGLNYYIALVIYDQKWWRLGISFQRTFVPKKITLPLLTNNWYFYSQVRSSDQRFYLRHKHHFVPRAADEERIPRHQSNIIALFHMFSLLLMIMPWCLIKYYQAFPTLRYPSISHAWIALFPSHYNYSH